MFLTCSCTMFCDLGSVVLKFSSAIVVVSSAEVRVFVSRGAIVVNNVLPSNA